MEIYSDEGNESDNLSSVSSASTKSTLLINAHTHKSLRDDTSKGVGRKETETVEYEPEYGEVDLESVHIETTATTTAVRDRFSGSYSNNVTISVPANGTTKAKKSGRMAESDSQQSVIDELQKIR